MKIKNKKKLNLIIAAFLTVFVVGSAFAFVSQGPLVFQGTANIEALLLLEIADYDVADVSDYATINNIEIHDGRKLATWEMNFTRPNQFVYINFDIENVGTIDAEIYQVNLTAEILENGRTGGTVGAVTLDYLLETYGIWVNWIDAVYPAVVSVGQYVTDAMTTQTYFFSPDPALGLNWLDITVEFTYSIDYRVAGQ